MVSNRERFPGPTTPVEGGFAYYEINDMQQMHAVLALYKEFPDAERVIDGLYRFLLDNYDGEENGAPIIRQSQGWVLARGEGPDKHYYISGFNVAGEPINQYAAISAEFPESETTALRLWDLVKNFKA
jgi:hypothetical protein